MKKKQLGRAAIALLIAVALIFTLIACDNGKSYSATFETNGGSAVAAMEKISTIESAPVTTREGYTLEGWYTNEALSGTKVTFPYTLTEDTTFYAKWSAAKETYRATFETNGGSAVAEQNTDVIAKEPRTSKSGYTFKGWYLDAETSGSRVKFPYTLSGDTTFYAKWAESQSKPSVSENLEAVSAKLGETYGLEENKAFKIDVTLAAGWTPTGGTYDGITVAVKGNIDYRDDANSVFYAEVKNNAEVLFGLYYEQGEAYLQLYGGGQPVL